MPIYLQNEITKKFEIKCTKTHNTEKDEFISMKLDQCLKLKLNYCENHLENKFCGWSKVDQRNLCFYEIGQELVNQKDYLLFMDLYPNIPEQKKNMYYQTIDSLKHLLNKYLNDYPNAEKEINYLNEIVVIIGNSFHSFYEQKIVNYQTIKNILFSLSIMPSKEEIDSLEKQLLVYIYGDLIIETTKKEVQNINIKEMNCEFVKKTKPQILQSVLPSPQQGGLSQGKTEIIQIFGENEQKFFYLFVKERESIEIYIYTIIGNNIYNTQYVKQNFQEYGEKSVEMVYNDKIIIIFNNRKLFFIVFSKTYNEYNSYSLDLNNLLNNNNINNHILINVYQDFDYDYDYFDFDSSNNNNELIKINQNNILLVYKSKAYEINLNENLNSISTFTKLEEVDHIIKARSIYYKRNNIIEKGIIILSRELKMIHRIYRANKLFLSLYIFDNKMKILDNFNFCIPIKRRGENIDIQEINYNFLNNMILIFCEKELYQINVLTQDLVSIYDISSYIFENEIKVSILYNYNGRNKQIEQMILFINKNANKITLLGWENKTILLKKEYEYKDILDFLPLYTPDIFNLFNPDNEIKLDKILLHSNKGILFH